MADATVAIGGRISTGDYSSAPIAASTGITKGTIVFANASGYMVDAVDTANFRLLGVARDDVDNSSGSAGDKTAEFWTEGCFDFTIGATADQSYVGRLVYPSDNQTVTLTPNDYTGPIGIVRAFNSTTSVRVELTPEIGISVGAGRNQVLHVALSAAADTAGAILSVANPLGATVIVNKLVLYITTASSGASTIDAGVAANGTTLSDTLIDSASGTPAKSWTQRNAGTNGTSDQAWTSTQFITASTASGAISGMVGTALIYYTRL